jgi:hypothetical protein
VSDPWRRWGWAAQRVQQGQRRANLGGALHRIVRGISGEQMRQRLIRRAAIGVSSRGCDLAALARRAHLSRPACDKALQPTGLYGRVEVAGALLVGEDTTRALNERVRSGARRMCSRCRLPLRVRLPTHVASPLGHARHTLRPAF